MGKTFHNEYLINKVLICLNQCWQLKVTVIRVAENEEGDKRKKIRALKFKETNETKRDEDVNILVNKFKKNS